MYLASVYYIRDNIETETFRRFQRENLKVSFYFLQISDVDQGGATVFPDIGLTLWPKKGAAVFWYNLYKNGEGDVRTRHAACPVLAGTKWGNNVLLIGPFHFFKTVFLYSIKLLDPRKRPRIYQTMCDQSCIVNSVLQLNDTLCNLPKSLHINSFSK